MVVIVIGIVGLSPDSTNLSGGVEAGISYSTTKSGPWRWFLNTEADTPKGDALTSQPNPGDTIHIKLILNSDGYAYFYVNGYLKAKALFPNNSSILKRAKFVMASESFSDISHSKVQFCQCQLKDEAGNWVLWESSTTYESVIDRPWGTPYYVLDEEFPCFAGHVD